MKLMAYYMLGFKKTTDHSTLYDLGQFITKNQVPIQFITGIHSVLGAGNFWKRVLRRTFTPLFLSETDKHHRN